MNFLGDFRRIFTMWKCTLPQNQTPMKITYYGHACFGVEVAGKHLLFDPFISPNELAKDIDINTVPADYILVSHGHEDHIADLISIAKRTGATIVSSYEIVMWAGKQGAENGHPMNTGGQWQFDFGTVKCFQAEHSSSFPDGSYAGNPMGFIINTDEGNFYYAGDTALFSDMKMIKELYPVDVAFLPIGDNFTMGVSDAVVASQWIGCQKIVGMHYDTFGFVVVDHDQAKAAFAEKGAQLELMKIGTTLDI